jgi:hypothetical protein
MMRGRGRATGGARGGGGGRRGGGRGGGPARGGGGGRGGGPPEQHAGDAAWTGPNLPGAGMHPPAGQYPPPFAPAFQFGPPGGFPPPTPPGMQPSPSGSFEAPWFANEFPGHLQPSPRGMEPDGGGGAPWQNGNGPPPHHGEFNHQGQQQFMPPVAMPPQHAHELPAGPEQHYHEQQQQQQQQHYPGPQHGGPPPGWVDQQGAAPDFSSAEFVRITPAHVAGPPGPHYNDRQYPPPARAGGSGRGYGRGGDRSPGALGPNPWSAEDRSGRFGAASGAAPGRGSSAGGGARGGGASPGFNSPRGGNSNAGRGQGGGRGNGSSSGRGNIAGRAFVIPPPAARPAARAGAVGAKAARAPAAAAAGGSSKAQGGVRSPAAAAAGKAPAAKAAAGKGAAGKGPAAKAPATWPASSKQGKAEAAAARAAGLVAQRPVAAAAPAPVSKQTAEQIFRAKSCAGRMATAVIHEYAQAVKLPPPVFNTGPGPDRQILVELQIGGATFGPVSAFNSKEAKARAGKLHYLAFCSLLISSIACHLHCSILSDQQQLFSYHHDQVSVVVLASGSSVSMRKWPVPVLPLLRISCFEVLQCCHSNTC